MIMHGIATPVESRYAVDIQIMRHMQWSWRELLEAPADLVEEIAFRMAQESKWTAERKKLDQQMK